MPQSPSEQKAIIQRMIDAGESEENIATVIQHFQKATGDTTSTRSPFNPPRLIQAAETAGRAISDVAVGAAKGAGSTVLSLSQLINKGTEAIGLSKPVAPEVWDRARQDFTTATNTAQSIGKGAEQVAEFFVPVGGAASKVGKAAETALLKNTPVYVDMAVEGAKQLAKSTPKMVQAAARGVGEGVKAAGIHSAQTGSTEGAGTVGAISAAMPVIGGAISKVAPALQQSAEKKVAQALGATKERFKAIAAKRAPEILKRGLVGSRASLLADAKENAAIAGQAIDDVLSAHGQTPLPTASITEALDQAKSGFMTTRQLSLADAFKSGALQTPGAKVAGSVVEVPVILDERAVQQLTKLQETVSQLGEEVPLDKLVALRRVWDDVVDRAGGYAHKAGGSNFGIPLAESTEAWAKKQGATALRKLFAESVPDIKAVNQEFAFWADLRSVLKATQARTQAQGPGLNRMVSAAVGAGLGAGAGHGDLTSAFIGGVVGPKVYQLITSARWRLVDANLRHKLADALAGDSAAEISAALGKVSAAMGSQAIRQSGGAP